MKAAGSVFMVGDADAGKLAHNERIKLLATSINSLGLAIAIGGFIAPALSGKLAPWSAVAVPVAWFGFGAALHGCAQIVLGRLKA